MRPMVVLRLAEMARHGWGEEGDRTKIWTLSPGSMAAAGVVVAGVGRDEYGFGVGLFVLIYIGLGKWASRRLEELG